MGVREFVKMFHIAAPQDSKIGYCVFESNVNTHPHVHSESEALLS